MSRFGSGRPVGASVLVALCAVLVAAAGAADEPVEINATDAAQHVGEFAEVSGEVASTAYLASTGGSPTFLNFERPYPDQVFTVVIWGSNRNRFDGRPENLYDGKKLRVTGTIKMYEGTPQITVEDPGQIAFEEPPAGGGLRDLEKVFVKAMLASLGYDANYGSGEWDQETVEAMLAFQEVAGLDPTGEPDPASLRALADAIEDMPDSDRDLVIRLLLFELARRQE